MKTKQFGNYSKYYDQIYHDKDYDGEVAFLEKLMIRHSTLKVKNILSLGCGTCSHDIILAKKGYDIVGVDKSSEMLKIAQKKIDSSHLQNKITLFNYDTQSMPIKKQFDASIAMFNILGYQNTNEQIATTLQQVKTVTKNDGLFIFDCWYMPAVIKDPPTDRIKEITTKDAKVIRLTRSFLELDKDIVNITFRVLKLNGKKIDSDTRESHPMRYFSLPEISYILKQNSFKLVQTYDWLDLNSAASGRRWDIFVVARREAKS